MTSGCAWLPRSSRWISPCTLRHDSDALLDEQVFRVINP
jgi:hypothetical protein